MDFIAPPAVTATPAPLAAYRWHRRVLILFAPRGDDVTARAQMNALARDASGLRGRDIHLVTVFGPQVAGLAGAGADLRARFAVATGTFALRLVGKDGHVAIAQSTPIAARDLFAVIDAMPMRRDEMRRARDR